MLSLVSVLNQLTIEVLRVMRGPLGGYWGCADTERGEKIANILSERSLRSGERIFRFLRSVP